MSADGRQRPSASCLSTSRLWAVAATALYTAAFHLTYRDLVVPQQASWGAGYRSLPDSVLVFIYVACILPSTWMPLRFVRPSLILFYVQYYLVFVPVAFIVFYLQLPQLSTGQAIALVVWSEAGLAVLQAGYLLPLPRIRRVRLSPPLAWATLAGFGIGALAYVVLTLRSNLHLVGLAQVYDVRAALADMLTQQGSRLVVYVEGWVANVVLPLAFALAIHARRRGWAAAVLSGYIFVFGVSGQKIALMAVLYLPAFYLLLRTRRTSVPGVLAATLALVLLSGYPVVALAPPVVSLWYVALLHFRTFTIQGINFGQYYAFFLDHPVTHFAHLAGVRWFVNYPYPTDIPYVLGDYFYNVPVGNNSGMWAADAIAGVGAWGIPLVSAVAVLVFWIVDACAQGVDPRFAGLAIAYISATFANVSLGTTLVSGGLGLACVVFLLLPDRGCFADHYRRNGRSRAAETGPGARAAPLMTA